MNPWRLHVLVRALLKWPILTQSYMYSQPNNKATLITFWWCGSQILQGVNVINDFDIYYISYFWQVNSCKLSNSDSHDKSIKTMSDGVTSERVGYSILWFILLVFVAFPIAFICAPCYILFYAFEPCIPPCGVSSLCQYCVHLFLSTKLTPSPGSSSDKSPSSTVPGKCLRVL